TITLLEQVDDFVPAQATQSSMPRDSLPRGAGESRPDRFNLWSSKRVPPCHPALCNASMRIANSCGIADSGSRPGKDWAARPVETGSIHLYTVTRLALSATILPRGDPENPE